MDEESYVEEKIFSGGLIKIPVVNSKGIEKLRDYELTARSKIIERYSKEIDALVSEMLKDVKLRNFLCVDIQDIMRRVHKDIGQEVFGNEHGGKIDITNIGFAQKQKDGGEISEVSKIEEKDIATYQDLYEKYKEAHYLLTGEKEDFKENIERPFEKFLKLIGIADNGRFIDKIKGVVRCKPDSRENSNLRLELGEASIKRKSRILLEVGILWQNKVIYERFVGQLIREETNFDVLSNSIVAVNLKEHSTEDYLDGHLEIDEIACNEKDGKITLIECKGGGHLNLTHLTDTIGKIVIMNELLGIKIEKCCMVSTGEVSPGLSGITKAGGIYIHISGRNSYRNNYKDMTGFIARV